MESNGVDVVSAKPVKSGFQDDVNSFKNEPSDVNDDVQVGPQDNEIVETSGSTDDGAVNIAEIERGPKVPEVEENDEIIARHLERNQIDKLKMTAGVGNENDKPVTQGASEDIAPEAFKLDNDELIARHLQQNQVDKVKMTGGAIDIDADDYGEGQNIETKGNNNIPDDDSIVDDNETADPLNKVGEADVDAKEVEEANQDISHLFNDDVASEISEVEGNETKGNVAFDPDKEIMLEIDKNGLVIDDDNNANDEINPGDPIPADRKRAFL